MSDIAADREHLDLAEQIGRIDRMREETRKFSAEQNKLAEEAGKLRREKWVVPLTAFVTVLGGIAVGAVARLPEILHALGLGH